MKFPRFSWWNLLFLAGGGTLLIVAFRNFQWDVFWDSLEQTQWSLVLMGLLVGLISHWLRGIRWRRMVQSAGYQLSPRVAFASVLAGYFWNIFIPRGGEVMRCVLTGRKERQIPASYLLGTVVTERLVDMLVLLTLILVVLSLQWKILGPPIQEWISHRVMGWREDLQNPIWLGILLGMILLGTGIWMLIRFSRIGQWLQEVWLHFREGFASLKKLSPKQQLLFWMETGGMWFLYVVMTWLPVRAFPSTREAGWEEVLGIFVYGALGIVAPVQGGIGTYHWLVQQVMLLYGYEAQTGLELATLIHSSQTIVLLIAGGISHLWLSLSIRNESVHAKAIQ